jgi:hypothetical protein
MRLFIAQVAVLLAPAGDTAIGSPRDKVYMNAIKRLYEPEPEYWDRPGQPGQLCAVLKERNRNTVHTHTQKWHFKRGNKIYSLTIKQKGFFQNEKRKFCSLRAKKDQSTHSGKCFFSFEINENEDSKSGIGRLIFEGPQRTEFHQREKAINIVY